MRVPRRGIGGGSDLFSLSLYSWEVDCGSVDSHSSRRVPGGLEVTVHPPCSYGPTLRYDPSRPGGPLKVLGLQIHVDWSQSLSGSERR